MPIIIMRIPLTNETAGRYLENFLKYFEKFPMAKAVSRKGIARPKKYTSSNIIPFPIVAILPA